MTHPAQLDPVLIALIDRLPAADDPFTTGDRERWVAAVDATLQFLYPPEWAPEARKRAREARNGPVTCEPTTVHLGGPQPAGWDVVDRIKAEQAQVIQEGLAQFGHHLEVRIAEEIEVMERAARKAKYARSEEEAPSTTSADAVDDESGAGSSTSPPSTHSGADPADDTSSPLPAGPDSAPTSLSSGETAPTNPDGFTRRQKVKLVRRCVSDGIDEVAEAERLSPSSLRRWMLEFPDVVRSAEEQLGFAPPKGRST